MGVLSVYLSVPKDFVHAPTIFLLFINDLTSPNSLHCFVDDILPRWSFSYPTIRQATRSITILLSSVCRPLPVSEQSLLATLPTICFSAAITSLLSISLKHLPHSPPIEFQSDFPSFHWVTLIAGLGHKIFSLRWSSWMSTHSVLFSTPDGFQIYFTFYTPECFSHVWGGELSLPPFIL